MLYTILVIILILWLIGGVAPGPWQLGGPGPYWGGGFGVILVVLLILFLLGGRV